MNVPIHISPGSLFSMPRPSAALATRVSAGIQRMSALLDASGYALVDTPSSAAFTLQVFGDSDQPFHAALSRSRTVGGQVANENGFITLFNRADAAYDRASARGGAMAQCLRLLCQATNSVSFLLREVHTEMGKVVTDKDRATWYLPAAKILLARLRGNESIAASVAATERGSSGWRKTVIGAIHALGAGIVQLSDNVLPKVEGADVARQLLAFLGRPSSENIEHLALTAWLASAQRIAGLTESSPSETPSRMSVGRDKQSMDSGPRLPFTLSPFAGNDGTVAYWNEPIRVVRNAGGSNYDCAIAATLPMGRYLSHAHSCLG